MSFDMFSLMQRRAQGRRGGAGAQGSGFGMPGGFSNLFSAGSGTSGLGLDPKAFTAFPMAPSSFSPNSPPPAAQQTSESSSSAPSESQQSSASPLSGGPAGNLASLTSLGGFDTGIFESFLGSKNGGGQ